MNDEKIVERIAKDVLGGNARQSEDLDLDVVDVVEEDDDPNFSAKVRMLRSQLARLTKMKNKKLSTFGIGTIRGRNTVEELVDVLNGIIGGGLKASVKTASKFKLGRVVMTSGVRDRMGEDPSFKRFVDKSFRKYSRGDWGDSYGEDADENDRAVEEGESRILAVYKDGKSKIWIITEWNGSATTILFPSEY